MARKIDFEVESAISAEQLHAAHCYRDYGRHGWRSMATNGRLDAIGILDGSVRLVAVQDKT